MCARVEPCEPDAERLHHQFVVGKELLIHRGDFQFSACRGLDVLGHLHHLVGIEVQAHNGVVALRLRRLFLDAHAAPFCVELHHAVALGVVHAIAEHGGLGVFLRRLHRCTQNVAEVAAVEDVVAQHEANAVIADKLFADDKGLCQSVGRGLLGVFEVNAVVAAIAQQAAEAREVLRRGDNEDFADAGKHQNRNGVIHHRFVENRNKLLADAFGNGVKARAAAAGEDNSFHSRLFKC